MTDGIAGLMSSAYRASPIALQHLACSLEGYRIQRARFGASFHELLRQAESRQSFSAMQMLAFRDARLHAFVQQACTSVPYYRQLCAERGFAPECLSALADLEPWPVLTKEAVKAAGRSMLSTLVPPRDHLLASTNGTTGSGLRFATTRAAQQEMWATWWRYWRWHGIQPGTWCGHFGGKLIVPAAQPAPPFWRYNYPGRQIRFSGYHMSPANLHAYVCTLQRRRPPWLHGYPSLLALLASYIVENDLSLGYDIRWVTTGSENLLPQQRNLMELAFGVPPRQHYGMAEGVANFSECEHGRLHVDEDFAAVEFIPDEATGACRVIGTNVSNPATPLIRYDVQDRVTLDDKPCTCGRPGRIVASIDGRSEDYVVLKSGVRIGRMAGALQHLTSIKEAQIVQKRAGEVCIRIVRGQGYSTADEARLLQEIHARAGADLDVRIEYLTQLERSASGKLRFVVSELAQGQLTSVGS
ncbi:MAG: phenylacetate--CoA ligase family protein [Chloroflexi bacterium]|nr:phenylacetate--CoA ligase family protein [Chloroflexota bacterium]